MESLVDNGEKWMRPLIGIRDYLSETVQRTEGEVYEFEEWRMPVRDEEGKKAQVHTGLEFEQRS